MRRALGLLALLIAGCGGSGDDPAPPPVAAPKPFVPVESSTPQPDAPRFRTARLKHATALRARPGGRVLHRLSRRTEFGTPTTLAVLRRRGDWLRVISSELPNHRRGWIDARAARLGGTDYEIRVDRSARRATLHRDGRHVFRFAVAVGRPGNETPLGRFAVTDKLAPTDETSPYGCCALALSGHQTRLEPGWPGGDRLAIHGTPAPETVGHPVSLGCMRAYERPLKRLLRRVPLGAPVFIRA